MGDMESAGSYSASEEIPRYYSQFEASFSKWQLDPDETLEELTHNLRGEQRDPDSGDWVLPQGAHPLMNERGVQDTISSLRFIINKNTPLSILKEDTINEMCLIRSLYLIDRLSAHMDEYHINAIDFPTIVNDIMDAVYIYLSRAKDGDTLHGIQRVYKLFEKAGDQQPEKQQGLSLGFFGKVKGGK